MSFFDIVKSDFNTVSVNTEFSSAVTRYPAGNMDGGVAVAGAVWIEGDPVRETEYGEQTQRTGVLRVPTTVTVTSKDQWLIAGELWQTTRATNQEVGGLKELYLQRNDKQNVKGLRGPLL